MAPQALDIEGAVESQKKSMAVDDDGRPARTGNEWTALAHLVTAVSGAGVLSLAWSMSQIGWVAGSIILVLLALATLYSSSLLSDCYRHPDPAAGARNHTYTKCVNAILGKRQAWFCALAQYADLYGATVAFTIVASSSIAAIAQSVCYRKHGKNTPCDAVTGRYTLIFGGIQIFFSQLQDMQRVRWLSILATVMSFSYSFIVLSLSAIKASEHGHSHGTSFGVLVGSNMLVHVTTYQKTLGVLQAIGNMCYSFLFTSILIEIQDTLSSSPPENKTMRKTLLIGIVYTTMFYMALGGTGYAAYGDKTPGNLLSALVSYRHVFWLVDLANLFIIVRLVGDCTAHLRIRGVSCFDLLPKENNAKREATFTCSTSVAEEIQPRPSYNLQDSVEDVFCHPHNNDIYGISLLQFHPGPAGCPGILAPHNLLSDSDAYEEV
ncbi:hypothetical protein O6H91_13G080800 [Diphasiastrum complanatum]|uniref:Uncharacterized protein n=1 Tax=Diphasiastrum complanatum TaxID=34168 RepID=A0ACC2BWF5_DIPCM|nr:hypothetical protein O6H91_13G080800 [Diphasiastrum complanatum]